MPYFQTDDQLSANRKVRTLIEGSMVGELDGLAALGMWTLAGTQSQASLTDGVLTRPDLIRLLLNPALVDDLASRLVDGGLWHGHDHRCDRCPPVAEGTWLFHDWFQFGYDTGEQVKSTRARRQELKDRKVIDAVWARDCLDPANPALAKCRYCGVVVNRHDRKSPDKPAPWPDHVDPAKAKGVRNLVIACDGCNRRKGQRTPAQAGMELLPPPRPDREDPTVVLAAPATQQRRSTADTAREDVRPAPADPAPSLARPVAERTARVAGAEPPDLGPDQTDQTQNQMDRDLITGGLVRARDRARAGQGDGRDRQGQQQGQPADTAPGRRRGRRGRRAGAPAGPPSVAGSAQGGWDAGVAPEVQPPGRFGSPWHGWRGAPPDAQVMEETTCSEHGLPQPCRKCLPQWAIDEGWGS